MIVIDAKGGKLDELLFISAYRSAVKQAPARFMTMRVHPDMYKHLLDIADVPESIQMGTTPGPMGKRVNRIACVKPANGINDGVAITQDPEYDRDKLEFQIHGIAEIIVVNIGAPDGR